MTKEEFQRMSEDHAMVKVSKHPLEQDAYLIQESANNEERSENCAPSLCSNDLRGYNDASSSFFANDITDQINNVLAKYRNNDEGIVDAHTLLHIESEDAEDESFDQAQGKLFCA